MDVTSDDSNGRHVPAWWEEFFSRSTLDFVRYSRDEESTQAEADFVQQALGLPLGAKILDLPCGAGRIALEMASRGYSVTGLDFSSPLLESARFESDVRRLAVRWEHRDMRDLPWSEGFDGAVCLWSSFGYFDEQGNSDFLVAVAKALRHGARFVLDTPLLETRLPEIESEPRVWWKVGDLYALEERRFNHVTSRTESQWTFLRNGQVETKRLSQRLYTFNELSRLLEHASFGNLRAFGTLELDPFSLGSAWLYLVATKD